VRDKTFLESALGRTFGISEMNVLYCLLIVTYYCDVDKYLATIVNCKVKTNPNVVIADIEFQDTLATDKAVFYSDSGVCNSNTRN
jgi:hypothetical protein